MPPLFTFLARLAGLSAVVVGLVPVALGQTFAPAVTYQLDNNSIPIGVVLADLNADGRRDIVLACSGTNQAGVLLGNGNGTFQRVVSYATGGGSPDAVAVADVNGDGRPDLVAANSTGNNVGVLLGTGSGTFLAALLYSTGAGSYPLGVAIADVNGDGRPDIISANHSSRSVGVLLGNGNGTFQAVVTYETGASDPNRVGVADLNVDGKPDLLTANANGSEVAVLPGSGNGTFPTVTSYALAPGSQSNSLAVADVNADGRLDVVTSNVTPGVEVAVLLGNGNGSLQASTVYTTGSNTYSNDVAVSDVTGDGRPDIITANPGNGTVGVLAGQAGGTFRPALSFVAGANGGAPFGVAVGDVNGDNKPDIIAGNGTNGVGVLLNTTGLATTAALPGAGATLAPNPARAAATLAATGLPTEARSLEATLYNALGEVVRRLAVPAAAGVARAAVPTAGLPAGVYLLRLAVLDAQGAALGTLPTQRLAVE